jgi:holliday junction DNA helicase RuvA
MIARLRGRVAGRAGGGLIVDVNGVGYLVHAAPSVQRLGGGEITIEIHTIVREDALQLYGFATADERELFELLLGVSGVGPKVALAIVSGSTPAELRRAIARDDVKRFQAIQGVGLKTAQRVVLELKEKLSTADALAAEANDATLARDALVNLGWSLLDAERALATIDEALPVEQQVREALRTAA